MAASAYSYLVHESRATLRLIFLKVYRKFEKADWSKFLKRYNISPLFNSATDSFMSIFWTILGQQKIGLKIDMKPPVAE